MGLLPIPGALFPEPDHGLHRPDQPAGLGVDVHRGAEPGQRGIHLEGDGLGSHRIGGTKAGEHLHQGALGKDPIDLSRHLRQDLWAVEVGDDRRLVQDQRLGKLVAVEDLQTAIQRVVADLGQNCVDEGLGGDQLDLDAGGEQLAHRELTHHWASRHCVNNGS